MDLSQQRGAFAIELDQNLTRIVFFDMAATWQLHERFGPAFISQLYDMEGETRLKLISLDNLAIFTAIGLERESRERGEVPLTAEQVSEYLRPWNYSEIFRRVVYAVVGATATPEQLGKAPADGPAAEPAAAPAAVGKLRKTPRPTRVSTSMKRSASRTRSSAGRQKSSGR